ncbi:MAG: outer membrane protein assembly factor BamD [Verrucomicrobiota bacterium JB022]|nr:outer membrane protein assembly factor BamD [Verrucomicrobiota bacterium JB022]
MVRFRLISLLGLAAATLTPNTHAAWWNPFDRGIEPAQMSADEQDIAARPLFERAQREFDKGDFDEAADLTKRLARRYPLSSYAAQALFLRGRARYEDAKYTPAFEALQQIIGRYPEYPHFNEVIRLQFEIALAEAEGKGLSFLFVFPYKKYNTSAAHFEMIVLNAPYSEFAPLALMNMARIYQYNGKTIQAVDALDRMINLYPNGQLTDDAYLELATTFAAETSGALYDQGATREAINYYRDYLILFPNENEVSQAEQGLEEMLDLNARSKLVLGRYFFRYRDDYTAASIFLNEAITLAPDSEAAQEARELLARIAEIRAEEGEPEPDTPAGETVSQPVEAGPVDNLPDSPAASAAEGDAARVE